MQAAAPAAANAAANAAASAQATRVLRMHWTEPEQRATRQAGSFDIRMQRLAGGHFSSQATVMQTPLLRVTLERLQGAPMRAVGRLADGYVHACVAVGPQALLDGTALQLPSLHLHGAGASFDATSSGAWTCAQLRLDRRALADPDDPLHAWCDANLGRARVLPAAGSSLAALVQTLAHRTLDWPDGLAALPEPLLLDDVLHALRQAAGSAGPPAAAATGARARAARRRLALAAEEQVRAALAAETPLSVTALCQALGSSERALQLACREQFGTNLRSYLLAARLQQAHALLLQAGGRLTLTEIATQCGLWHLGRFARYYRGQFGCTPSEMQRRVWGQLSTAAVAAAAARLSPSPAPRRPGR